MIPFKLAVQVDGLGLPLRQALHVVQQMGATGVELAARGDLRPGAVSQSAVRQIRKWVDDLGLRIVALDFYTRRGYEVADDLDRRVEATKAALQLAHQLGAPCVVNHVGRVPDAEDAATFQRMVEVLSDLGHYGHHVGTLLAAETGSEPGSELRRLIESLPTAALQVALDPGNLIVGGFAPLEAVAELGSQIIHVHASDAVRDRAGGRGAAVELGRGMVDFPALLGALEERGYRGFLSIERPDAHDPAMEISQAVHYLKSLG